MTIFMIRAAIDDLKSFHCCSHSEGRVEMKHHMRLLFAKPMRAKLLIFILVIFVTANDLKTFFPLNYCRGDYFSRR